MLAQPQWAPAVAAGRELAALARDIGAEPASLAMAFALLDPSVTTVLFGATRPEQISANLGALALAERLTPGERDRLPAVGVPYADRVPRLEACLVDAYDTIVTCDFSILRNELSALAGISPETWQVEYARIGALVSDGRLSKTEAFMRLLRAAGREASPALVAELVRQ